MVEINKRSKTCSGGDCSHLNMGLLFGILIPCLLCCFGFIWKIICRKKRVPPQVQVTHHVIHSNGPSVPGYAGFIRFSASTMGSCAGYSTSAEVHLPTGYSISSRAHLPSISATVLPKSVNARKKRVSLGRRGLCCCC